MDIFKKILKLILRKIRKEKEVFFFILFLFLSLVLLANFSDKYLVKIPKKGGEVNEIVIKDIPRFINPVLGTTNVDKSLISLVYSSLFRLDKNGNLIDNIASYKIDKNGKKYLISLKKNLFFSDGVELTSDDVIFTIQQIQKPENNSFYRSDWVGVESKKIDRYHLELILPRESYYFKNSLVLYILPKHIWEKIKYFNLDDKNLISIGSGKFRIEKINWDNSNTKQIKSIILTKNPKYSGEIWMDRIIFHFFETKANFIESELFNSDKNINLFSYDRISNLDKYALNEISEPIDINLIIRNNNKNKFLAKQKIRKYIFDVWKSKDNDFSKLRKKILVDKNFSYDKKNNLLKYKNEIISFLVYTGKNEDESLIKITNRLKDKLRWAGIVMSLKNIEPDEFQDIIRSRKFEAIVSGYYNQEKYWFYYYHSSQKNDPWINIAQFDSKKLDNITLILRKNLAKNRREYIKAFRGELENQVLVLKLENLKSYYYFSKPIENLELDKINSGENRFWNIQNWIVLKEKVLPIFK